MSTTQLIAVNCHPFHALQDILAGLKSLGRAVGIFRQQARVQVDVRVFWHSRDPTPEQVQDLAKLEAFDIVEFPHLSNGENLNAQIETAIRDGYDFFFRVDGDDTVTSQRFMHQLAMLRAGDCDICGAGLRYKLADETSFVMLPETDPGARQYIENRYILHPTMAFSVDSFARSNLRYWSHRLEDKALILNAQRAGLRIRNVPVVAGGYRVGRDARSRFNQKWLGLRLNLAYLGHVGQWRLIPYALALFLGQIVLGSHNLRRIRFMMHRLRARELRLGGVGPDFGDPAGQSVHRSSGTDGGIGRK